MINVLRRMLQKTVQSRAGRLNDASAPESDHTKTLARSVKYFCRSGPHFEASAETESVPGPARARVTAFYLPQFYPFPENDKWWGTGFTEWQNVVRGLPRFVGHYQPRTPADLGFYDLRDGTTQLSQISMARQAGISAFCFYYYWFNGKRLMQDPLETFLATEDDFEFSILWANENWTRTWDGKQNDILISQDYLHEHEQAFIDDTARYMAHPRYQRLSGRPLFILYRPGLIEDAAATFERWRNRWTESLGVAPLIYMVQGFGDEDPYQYGLDGALEFPPHKICRGVPNIARDQVLLDEDFSGEVYDYPAVVDNALKMNSDSFPLIKAVSPSWDNDARREGRGMCWRGSTPEMYKKWLRGALSYAEQNPSHGESMVYINAWNEWAEGAYLEPDRHHGYAYLNATRQAVYQR